MLVLKSLLTTVLLLLLANSTLAQVDPSAALLLRKSKTVSKDYDSSRYTVKPKTPTEDNIITQPLPTVRKPQVHQTTNDVRKEKEDQELSKEVEFADKPRLIEKKKEDSSKALSNMKVIEPKSLQEYKSYLHYNDKRNNMIEFSLGLNYFYQESSSRYWFRNYHTTGPGLDADMMLWLSPFLGIQMSYTSSLASELRAEPEGSEYLDVDHSWFRVGLQYRKFFGISRKAKSFNVGLGFYDKQLDVPTSASQRMGLQSKGFRISVEADLPTSNQSSWLVGFELMPKLSHKETIDETNIKSGGSNQSSAIGLWWGKKLRFDRKNHIYWKLSHRVENNKFTGDSSTTDPLRQEALTGVGVTSGTSSLQLGFTWGR